MGGDDSQMERDESKCIPIATTQLPFPERDSREG